MFLYIQIVYFQVIEIQLDKLPEYEEVLGILKSEHSNLHIWVNLAVCIIY